MLRRSALVLAAATAFALAGGIVPASAAPSGTKVARVFQLPCQGSTCVAGKDRTVPADGLVDDAVQVHVSSQASLGLESVRLEARTRGGQWTCMRSWAPSGETFSGVFNWDTNFWPGGCDGDGSGPITANGEFDLRVIAREKTVSSNEKFSDSTEVSGTFTLRVDNRPDPPVWGADPSVAGAEERAPVVTLRWRANPEPDIVEYHYVRSQDGGGEIEFAVSASDPGAQGCARDGADYVCTDDVFPSKDYGGRYEYSVIAYRSSPSSKDACALPPAGSCVQSQLSPVRAVSVYEPPPPPPPPVHRPSSSATPAGKASSRASAKPRPPVHVLDNLTFRSTPRDEYIEGEFDEALPYGNRHVVKPQRRAESQRSVLAAGDPVGAPERDGRMPWLPLAAGMLSVAIALHMARLLRSDA